MTSISPWQDILFSPVRTTATMLQQGDGWPQVWPLIIGAGIASSVAGVSFSTQAFVPAVFSGAVGAVISAWLYPKLIAWLANVSNLPASEHTVRFAFAWGSVPSMYASVLLLLGGIAAGGALGIMGGLGGLQAFVMGACISTGLVLSFWSFLTVVGALAGALQTSPLRAFALLFATSVLLALVFGALGLLLSLIF